MRQRAEKGLQPSPQETGKEIPGGKRGEESPSGRRPVGVSAGEQSDHGGRPAPRTPTCGL